MFTPSGAQRQHSHAFLALTAAAAISLAASSGVSAQATETDNEPVVGANGQYFVDSYHSNDYGNETIETNAGVSLLSEFYEVWEPAADGEWYNGTVLNQEFQEANHNYVLQSTANRTEDEATYDYLVARRNQSYTAIDGLGDDADTFRNLANADTEILSVPDDGETTKYSDHATWADTESVVGSMVTLVNTVRGENTSSNPTKYVFNYPRPFRLLASESEDGTATVDTSIVVPALIGSLHLDEDEANTDGGFPSGHTNAAYLASLGLAYSTPAHYSELLYNASEMGESRISSGVHSPSDVIGGRILGTALAASILYDSANDDLKASALSESQASLGTEIDTLTQDEYESMLATYTDRLTYGLPMNGETGQSAVVPKGAEVLLETRLPYLSDEQRREVLRTTALESGHALLDDAEGWGRLNLLAATGGYGAFDSDVTVSLDASQTGYNAADTWRNDITGSGTLLLEGTGTLGLAGDNSYAGGTTIDGGVLSAQSATALGTGDVSAQAGTLSEDTDQVLAIGGSLTLADDATYAATIEDAAQASVSVAGDLTLDGDLTVTLPEGLSMEPEEVLLASVGGEIAGEFDSVSVTGSESEWNVQVRDGELWLTTAVDTPDDPGTGVDPSPTDIDCAVVLEQIWNFLDDLWRFFSRLFLP